MAETKSIQREYETMVIVPADTSQPDVDGFVDKLKGILTSNEGTVKGIQPWGRRRLAFPIKRHRDGLYLFLEYNGSSKTPNEINSFLRVSDMSIRHLTILKEVKKQTATRMVVEGGPGGVKTETTQAVEKKESSPQK